jgi:hypothetical protein
MFHIHRDRDDHSVYAGRLGGFRRRIPGAERRNGDRPHRDSAEAPRLRWAAPPKASLMKHVKPNQIGSLPLKPVWTITCSSAVRALCDTRSSRDNEYDPAIRK